MPLAIDEMPDNCQPLSSPRPIALFILPARAIGQERVPRDVQHLRAILSGDAIRAVRIVGVDTRVFVAQGAARLAIGVGDEVLEVSAV